MSIHAVQESDLVIQIFGTSPLYCFQVWYSTPSVHHYGIPWFTCHKICDVLRSKFPSIENLPFCSDPKHLDFILELEGYGYFVEN